MIAFIIKSIACSAIFWAVYKLLLENERMHTFKRFYLLASVVLSLAIPAMTFHFETQGAVEIPRYIPINVVSPEVTYNMTETSEIKYNQDANTTDVWWWLLSGIYLIVCAFFTSRLVICFAKFRNIIKKSDLSLLGNAILVHTDQLAPPYSFLKYIFIGNYSSCNEEIIAHELTHVHQRHSFDKIFIEFIQALWWFNPMLILYKKAIYTNHEFLADESVINNYNDVARYQTLLLGSFPIAGTPGIANLFNFQITKKRLIMMTKNKLPKTLLAKKLAMIPLLACAVVMFSTIKAQVSGTSSGVEIKYPSTKKGVSIEAPSTQKGASKELMDEYEKILESMSIMIDGKKGYVVKDANDETPEIERLREIFVQMSKEQQDMQFLKFKYSIPLKIPTAEELAQWRDDYLYEIKIDGRMVEPRELSHYNMTDFAYYEVNSEGLKVIRDSNNVWQKVENDKKTIDLKTKTYLDQRGNSLNLVYNGGAITVAPDGVVIVFPSKPHKDENGQTNSISNSEMKVKMMEYILTGEIL